MAEVERRRPGQYILRCCDCDETLVNLDVLGAQVAQELVLEHAGHYLMLEPDPVHQALSEPGQGSGWRPG